MEFTLVRRIQFHNCFAAFFSFNPEDPVIVAVEEGDWDWEGLVSHFAFSCKRWKFAVQECLKFKASHDSVLSCSRSHEDLVNVISNSVSLLAVIDFLSVLDVVFDKLEGPLSAEESCKRERTYSFTPAPSG